VFYADYKTDAAGNPLYDAQGYLIPQFVPGENLGLNWLAVRGAEIDIRTTSLFVQDHWALNQNWSFDLGMRYERVRSDATGGIVGVDTDTWVPRLAASFDPRGDGKLIFQTTYAHYAGKYNEAQFAQNTNVGTPNLLLGVYTGPAGEGRSFSPGFNFNNYLVVLGDFPTANVFFEENLSSPVNREFTASVGTQIGRGHVKAMYTHRDLHNFVEDFFNLDTGSTEIVHEGENFGEFTNKLVANSNEPVRTYHGLQFQGRYPLSDRWSVNGHWTVQIKNDGNFEGEATNQPALSSPVGDYPEIFNEARHFPLGRLNEFQRNKVRLWSIYSLSFGRFGAADVSGMYRYDSPLSFSYVAEGLPLTATQNALGAAYASLAESQNIFFGERGSQLFASSHLVDLAFNYNIPVFKTLRPWLKVELFNVFNNDRLIAWNTTVEPNDDGPRDALGLPTTFIEGPRFGEGTANGHYAVPRTFQIAFGIRF
jgi:hypothetical protein